MAPTCRAEDWARANPTIWKAPIIGVCVEDGSGVQFCRKAQWHVYQHTDGAGDCSWMVSSLETVSHLSRKLPARIRLISSSVNGPNVTGWLLSWKQKQGDASKWNKEKGRNMKKYFCFLINRPQRVFFSLNWSIFHHMAHFREYSFLIHTDDEPLWYSSTRKRSPAGTVRPQLCLKWCVGVDLVLPVWAVRSGPSGAPHSWDERGPGEPCCVQTHACSLLKQTWTMASLCPPIDFLSGGRGGKKRD